MQPFCTTKFQQKKVEKFAKKFSIANAKDGLDFTLLCYSFYAHCAKEPMMLTELLNIPFNNDFPTWGRVELALSFIAILDGANPETSEKIHRHLHSVPEFSGETQNLALRDYFQDILSQSKLRDSMERIEKYVTAQDGKYEFYARCGAVANAALIKLVNHGADSALTASSPRRQKKSAALNY